MVVTDHREALTADFWQFYGCGWEEMLTQGSSVSSIADLAASLPRDSRIMLNLLPRREIESWSADTYLLAHIADLLAVANWQRSGGKGQRPKPVIRPKPGADFDEGFETAADFRDWYASQPGGRQLSN